MPILSIETGPGLSTEAVDKVVEKYLCFFVKARNWRLATI